MTNYLAQWAIGIVVSSVVLTLAYTKIILPTIAQLNAALSLVR